jgi:hypothetical protein
MMMMPDDQPECVQVMVNTLTLHKQGVYAGGVCAHGLGKLRGIGAWLGGICGDKSLSACIDLHAVLCRAGCCCPAGSAAA